MFVRVSNFKNKTNGKKDFGDWYDLTLVPQEIVEWYLILRGFSTYHAGLLSWAHLLSLGTYHWFFYRESVRSERELLGF